MKKLALLFFLMGCTPAAAGVPCSLPFNIQNGQPADATQVMANYNALVSCLGNAAASGSNNDITALNALSTPLAPSLGGTQVFTGVVTSTGTSNAQVVATTIPSTFTLTRGYTLIFVAGFTNTGPTTLTVASTAAANIFRQTPRGIFSLVGGEILAGGVTVVNFDGTQYQLLSNTSVPPGTILDTIAPQADLGFVLLQGQCIASTGVFNALFLIMGSPGQGPCASGQFPLPDARGRVTAMIDSGGSNRISIAGGNFDGTILYNSGGSQNHLMQLTELVSHTHNNSLNDPGHVHGGVINNSGLSVTGPGVAAPNTNTTNTASAFTGVSINNAAAGGGQAFSILPPVLMINKQIKY